MRRLMKRLKLQVIQRRAYKVTTVRKHSHRVADNLVNQDFNPKAANQVWAGEITYLRTYEGWLYLAVVMDLYSRRIIGWAMDKYISADLVKRAMQMAITMSGKGACWDNAVVERFFASLKNEWLLKIYHLTCESMKQDVQHYIRYYNQTRLHSANGDLSPIDFELSLSNVSGWI